MRTFTPPLIFVTANAMKKVDTFNHDMKIKSAFHAGIASLVILTFCYPIFALAQQDLEILQAITDAENDAKTDNNPYLWGSGTFVIAVIGGCMLGSLPLIGSFIYEPNVPSQRLLGKSPEYILFYTETYKKTVKNQNTINSLGGCIGGSFAAAVLWTAIYQHQ